MIVMLLLAVVLAVVCFKLGVYSMLFGLLQLLAKVLFFGTGLFLLTGHSLTVRGGGPSLGFTPRRQ